MLHHKQPYKEEREGWKNVCSETRTKPGNQHAKSEQHGQMPSTTKDR